VAPASPPRQNLEQGPGAKSQHGVGEDGGQQSDHEARYRAEDITRADDQIGAGLNVGDGRKGYAQDPADSVPNTATSATSFEPRARASNSKTKARAISPDSASVVSPQWGSMAQDGRATWSARQPMPTAAARPRQR
jgi:hypothetical protein